MLTAFIISSMPSRMPIVLRRVVTPNRPMQNTTAERIRYGCRPISAPPALVFRPGKVDGPKHPGEHEDREQLERQHVSGEHRLADRAREVAGHVWTRDGERMLAQDDDDEPEHDQRDKRAAA